MRILFVCHRLPFPPNRGGKIRPFNMIRHLSSRHSVVVASLAASRAELDAGHELRSYGVELLAELLPSAARWRQAVAALPTHTPSSVAYFSSARLRERVEEAARRTAFDVVMVHCAFVAHYVDGIAAGLRVLDFGDLDSAKWSAYASHRSIPLSLGYALEARKLRAYEAWLARRFDRCTVTTHGELEAFASLEVGTPCTVIPNGVDAGYFSPGPPLEGGPPSVIFLGRMDYFPNIDGALYFAEQVFPLLRRRAPEAELRIVGASPAAAVRRLARLPGVRVFADVPDVRPFLRRAAVSVAPLRVARGTQNKILESMAMGVPVVATPRAAKGIQGIAGEHLVVAEDAETFAVSVARLLEDPTLRQKFAEAGRAQVRLAHDWAAAMAILDRVLDQSPASVGSRTLPP